MTLPARIVSAVRPEASAGVIAGAAVVAAVFTATPMLLPDIAARLEVSVGLTGLLSAAQVGSFAVSAFLAGRLFRPRRRFHYGGLVVVAISSLASAVAPNFPLLLGARLLSGLGLGTLTWIAWADATRFARGMGDVAAVAPITATLGAPLIGWIVIQGGYPWVFLVLGLTAAAASMLPVDFGDLPKIGRSVSSSRSNRLLLVALALLTTGGSAVFIFSAATAQALHGLDAAAVSWALSVNAATGVVATRFNAPRGSVGLWLLGTASAALVVGTVTSVLVFYVALAWWGLAFWMAVPAVFQLIAERALTPAERVGDAQALMAMGRVAGPLIGVLALGAGQYDRLSMVGAAFMSVAALSVAGVELGRRRGWGPRRWE